MKNVSAALLTMVMGCVVTGGEVAQAADTQAPQKTAFLFPGFPCAGSSCAPVYQPSPCNVGGGCPPVSYRVYPMNNGYQSYPQYQQYPQYQPYQGYNGYPVQSYPAPGGYPVQYPQNPGYPAYYGAPQFYGSNAATSAPVRLESTSGYRGTAYPVNGSRGFPTNDPYFP